MLVGITLPLWAVNLSTIKSSFSIIDVIATIGCVAGIVIAYFADTQLYNFMTQ
jgi:steroid 5-alpha reductase family enzyme